MDEIRERWESEQGCWTPSNSLEAALDQIAVQNVNVRDDIAYLLAEVVALRASLKQIIACQTCGEIHEYRRGTKLKSGTWATDGCSTYVRLGTSEGLTGVENVARRALGLAEHP